MLITDLITNYRTHLEARQMSHNTILSYMKDLELFHRYCQETLEAETIDIAQINHEVIRKYLITLVQQKITARTIAHKMTTLKMFYKFLIINDHITINPMKKIKTPKYSEKLPNFFSEAEIDKLCEIPDTTTFVGMRNKAIIELFYSSGLRLSELVNLKLSNIDFYQKTVTIIGKGDKKRIVPVTDIAIEWMTKYSKIRDNIDTDIFFLSKKNQPFNRLQIYYIIKKSVSQLALRNGYSPHTIRHSFATHLLSKGADLFAIKEMLGHANLATTNIYTHITPENIRKEYIQGHPRAEKKLEIRS